jgi:hypothetical protein
MKTDLQLQQDMMAELKWEPAVHAAQIGVPKDQGIQYEAALKVDKYLLVVHGSADDQEKACSVLAPVKAPVAA